MNTPNDADPHERTALRGTPRERLLALLECWSSPIRDADDILLGKLVDELPEPHRDALFWLRRMPAFIAVKYDLDRADAEALRLKHELGRMCLAAIEGL